MQPQPQFNTNDSHFIAPGIEPTKTGPWDSSQPIREWSASPSLVGQTVQIPAIENGAAVLKPLVITPQMTMANIFPQPREYPAYQNWLLNQPFIDVKDSLGNPIDSAKDPRTNIRELYFKLSDAMTLFVELQQASPESLELVPSGLVREYVSGPNERRVAYDVAFPDGSFIPLGQYRAAKYKNGVGAPGHFGTTLVWIADPPPVEPTEHTPAPIVLPAGFDLDLSYAEPGVPPTIVILGPEQDIDGVFGANDRLMLKAVYSKVVLGK